MYYNSESKLQGGSDISGTLSMLHRRIKKTFFLFILSRKTVSAVCRSINRIIQTHSSKDESTGKPRR
jgi:hypothetical protein